MIPLICTDMVKEHPAGTNARRDIKRSVMERARLIPILIYENHHPHRSGLNRTAAKARDALSHLHD